MQVTSHKFASTLQTLDTVIIKTFISFDIAGKQCFKLKISRLRLSK